MVVSFDEMSRMKCATVMWTRVLAFGSPTALPQWSSGSLVGSSSRLGDAPSLSMESGSPVSHVSLQAPNLVVVCV